MNNAGHDDSNASNASNRGRTSSRLRRLAGSWEEVIAGAALAVVVGCVVYGVFARYVMPRPAAWSGELAGLAFTWVVFVGAASAFKHNMHIGIDAIVALLPINLRRLVEVLADLTILVFAGYVIWLSLQMGIEARGRPSAVLRIPFTFVYLAVAVGFASIFMRKLIMVRDRLSTGYKQEG